nr:MAG TPA_asm: hypothetical protein [Bacteriophage sp.]DAZ33982.1 MAG TPA: hypothetical protein [Caudoviricetes sp.]
MRCLPRRTIEGFNKKSVYRRSFLIQRRNSICVLFTQLILII